MLDVVALGELLIDFAPVSTDAAGYPTLAAQPGRRCWKAEPPQNRPRGRIQNTCSNAAGRGTIEVLRAWPRRAAGVKPAGGRSCVP